MAASSLTDSSTPHGNILGAFILRDSEWDHLKKCTTGKCEHSRYKSPVFRMHEWDMLSNPSKAWRIVHGITREDYQRLPYRPRGQCKNRKTCGHKLPPKRSASWEDLVPNMRAFYEHHGYTRDDYMKLKRTGRDTLCYGGVDCRCTLPKTRKRPWYAFPYQTQQLYERHGMTESVYNTLTRA